MGPRQRKARLSTLSILVTLLASSLLSSTIAVGPFLPRASASSGILGPVTSGSTSVSVPSGGSSYIYIAVTGGQYGITGTSFSQDMSGGNAEFGGPSVKIGHDTSNTGSFSSSATAPYITGIGLSLPIGSASMTSFDSTETDSSLTFAGSFSVSQSSFVLIAVGSDWTRTTGASLVVSGGSITSLAGQQYLLGYGELPPGAYSFTATFSSSIPPGGGFEKGAVVYEFPVRSTGTVWLDPPCVRGMAVEVNGGTSVELTATSISWNWGDGSTTSGGFPQAHAYVAKGQYAINVSANLSDGSTDSVSESVKVPAASNCLTVQISSSGGGSVAYSYSNGGGTVPAGNQRNIFITKGDSVTLTATPNSGLGFAGWSASYGESFGPNLLPIDTSSPSVTILPTDSGTIGATFAKLTAFTLTVTSQGGGTVTTHLGLKSSKVDSGQTKSFSVTSGTKVTLNAVPDKLHTFSAWTGTQSSSTNPITLTISGDASESVSFDLGTTGTCYKLDGKSESLSASATASGKIPDTAASYSLSVSGSASTGFAGPKLCVDPSSSTLSVSTALREKFNLAFKASLKAKWDTDWITIGPPIGAKTPLASLALTPVARLNATAQGHLNLDFNQAEELPIAMVYDYSSGAVSGGVGSARCRNEGTVSGGCVVTTSTYDLGGGIRLSVGLQLEASVVFVGRVRVTPSIYLQADAGASLGGSGYAPYCGHNAEGTDGSEWAGVCGGIAYSVNGKVLGSKFDFEGVPFSDLLAATMQISPTSITVAPGGTQSFSAVIAGSVSYSAKWSVSPLSGCGTLTTTGPSSSTEYDAPSSSSGCTATVSYSSSTYDLDSLLGLDPSTFSTSASVTVT